MEEMFADAAKQGLQDNCDRMVQYIETCAPWEVRYRQAFVFAVTLAPDYYATITQNGITGVYAIVVRGDVSRLDRDDFESGGLYKPSSRITCDADLVVALGDIRDKVKK